MTLKESEAAPGLRVPLRTPRSWAPHPVKLPTGWSFAAVALAILTVAAAAATGWQVRGALSAQAVTSPAIDGGALFVALLSVCLLLPAIDSVRKTRLARAHVKAGEIADGRVAAAGAKSAAWNTFGYAAAVLILLLVALFIVANDLAVGQTFFFLPLIGSTFRLILDAFWINIEIFCVAQILVLAWALVIVVARLAPGEAGRPVRLIATIYVDLFRALPAIISIYLVGFGLPLTGLPLVDQVPAMWFAVIALTLTYGAYVSEVYRAGIESVHGSQTAAARSLGLSFPQTLRYVVLPQAIRRIIPPLLNDFISLQKDTALVSVIGTVDAFNQAKMVASNHFNLSSVTTVAFLFVIITIPQSRFVDRLMAADQRRMRAGG